MAKQDTHIPGRHQHQRHGLILLALLGLATGCSDPGNEAVPKAEPGPVEATDQRPGDPAAGYDTLVNGGYMSCGIPYSAWRRATQPSESMPTLPNRSAPNSGMPYYLNRHENEQGVEIVSPNCLFCHGSEFNEELIIGLGNETRDFTDDPREFVDAVGSYVSGESETAAWQEWAEVITTMAPYMMTETVGVNPAPNVTLILMAHRHPETLEWYEKPRIEPPPERPLPVSVPPWWRMSKKNAMFYNAMGRGDHARFMMMKSLVCTDSVEEAEAIDAKFADVRAYIASLEAPDYPFDIDEELADRGRMIFEERCASCHGTYGNEDNYPNLVIDLETVGTDPAYARQAHGESDRFMRWFNQSWYGEISQARPAPGYIAPPLDGIWATAPFLHNGSVPTLRALLDSSERPAYWLHPSGSPRFDEEAVGWKYREPDHGKNGATDEKQRKRIYDTTLPGHSNAGHTFGDPLDDAQRQALLEYLKSL